MRFWVDKEQEKKPDGEWKDAYVFSINRSSGSVPARVLRSVPDPHG